MAEQTDVLVVGGGIGGLTAAIFAARGGAKVRLVEGAPAFGGRARTRDDKGFKFNFGPHALYLKGAAKRTLDALGLDPAGASPSISKGAYLVRDGALYSADIAKTKAYGAGEKLAFVTAFGSVAAGFKGKPGETVAAALNRLTKNLPAQSGIKAFIRVSTYSNAPEIASADAVFDQVRLANGGVRYLDGGWASMIASLAELARRAGAEIATEGRVETVAPHDGGWRATRADGQVIDARAIVLAVSPEDAARLAPNAARLKQAALECVPVRAASLDVALSRLPRDTHTFALGLDAPTYFSVHSKSAKGLAPEGGAMIHVSRYLGPEEGPSRDTRAELETVLDLMQPGWREVVVAEQWLPMAHVAHDLAVASRGGLGGRCPVAIAPGLFVAGDWVGAEGMLSDAAFASGRLAGEQAATLRAPAKLSAAF